MCAVFQIFGNCSLLIIQLNNSIISLKQNCKTKINLLGDIPSTQFAPYLHLLNSLRTSHCETKISDTRNENIAKRKYLKINKRKYISGKNFSLGTFNGSLSFLYANAKKTR